MLGRLLVDSVRLGEFGGCISNPASRAFAEYVLPATEPPWGKLLFDARDRGETLSGAGTSDGSPNGSKFPARGVEGTGWPVGVAVGKSVWGATTS
jgi:hypothetical protein